MAIKITYPIFYAGSREIAIRFQIIKTRVMEIQPCIIKEV